MCQELEIFNLLSADVEGRQNRNFWLLRSYPLKIGQFPKFVKISLLVASRTKLDAKIEFCDHFWSRNMFLGHFEKIVKNHVFLSEQGLKVSEQNIFKNRFSRLSL